MSVSARQGPLVGRVALITGAGRGQGRSHAVRLAQDGADVIAVDICRPLDSSVKYAMATESDLLETKAFVQAAGGQCRTAVADVRDAIELAAAVDEGIKTLGSLNIVVANAGVITWGRCWELSGQAWDTVIDTNLKGAWNTVKAAVPHLISGGHGGSVILISSAAGIRGQVGYAHYVASKHGVVGLMKAMSNELAEFQIRVNSIHPTGVSDTGMSLGEVQRIAARNSLFALGTTNTIADYVEPADVSNAVAWLASDESRYVTGLQLTVDAGNSTKP